MSIVLITGASSGIGKSSALALGREGYHVVAAGRSEERTQPVVEEVKAAGGSAEFLHLDLASLESVQHAAAEFVESGRTLDVLVNNAGVGAVKGVTEDGFELNFGVNHLGHFMLTHRLAPAFRPETRVVQVASAAHQNAPGIDFDRLRQRTRSLFGLKEYAVSKLANILFARELARRSPKLRTYSLHPGMVDTNIFPRGTKWLLRRRLLTPEQGADTVVWCASSSEVAEQTGLYYAHRQVRTPSQVAQDDELARELWEHSEEWCGVGA
jgi:NAD(P)-dependent dehydrogenase (short-subunit alcohol dehydrogenase family)